MRKFFDMWLLLCVLSGVLKDYRREKQVYYLISRIIYL